MEYVTSWERNGIKKGIVEGSLQTAREDVLDVLETRFGPVPPSISDAVAGIDDLETLKRMLRRAVLAAGPEEVLEETRVRSS